MKIFLLSIFLLATLAYTNGYSFIVPPSEKHPGTCYYNGLILKKGDNAMPSTCQNVHCNDDGSMVVSGCGHYDLRDCRVLDPVNLHKPYPDCCQMNFLCTNKNGETFHKEISPLEHY